MTKSKTGKPILDALIDASESFSDETLTPHTDESHEETGYTPGSWTIRPEMQAYTVHNSDLDICTVIATDITDSEAQANARLIAAAPTLLKICQEIANDPTVDLRDSERRIRLYSAITKAGGEL